MDGRWQILNRQVEKGIGRVVGWMEGQGVEEVEGMERMEESERVEVLEGVE